MRGALRFQQREIAAELDHIAEPVFLPQQHGLARKRLAQPLRTTEHLAGLVVNEGRLFVAILVLLPTLVETAEAQQ